MDGYGNGDNVRGVAGTMTLDPELAVVVDLANQMSAVAPQRSHVADMRAVARNAASAYGPGPEVHAVMDRTIPGSDAAGYGSTRQ